ncbi:MAG TPA: hypothetical protein VFV34_29585 [Blastocatellia bacterium]|nr:hypothetical protein [Blastocatellia bacterium]
MPRIIDQKNLAFADQPAPIPARELSQKIKERAALKESPASELEIKKFVATVGTPRVEAGVDRAFNPILRVWNFRAGEHVFPPNIEAVDLKTLGDKSESFNKPLVAEGLAPEHLPLSISPSPLPREMETQPFHRGNVSPAYDKRGNQATTVFPPENRTVFMNTSYPWSTCGRVDTPIGQGGGAMVGPRHLLTCSHIIQWNADGTAGWLRFRPAFFAPSEPFGDAWGTRVYFKQRVAGPNIDWIEGMYDYVVCVLDRPIGLSTGWLGGKGYTDSWDGGAYWVHVGYPTDLTAGNRPTFESAIALDGSWWQLDSHEAMSHRGDVWPGQSGGPFFGWWSDGPYAVAVQSSQNPSENNSSGGQDMVDLMLQARADHP